MYIMRSPIIYIILVIIALSIVVFTVVRRKFQEKSIDKQQVKTMCAIDSKTRADCTFCRISTGLEKATLYGKSDNALVLRSLSGGVLAIPVTHIASLKCLDQEHVGVIADMFVLAAQVAQTQFSHKYYQQAHFNTGARAGQTQFHVHMHVSLTDTKKNSAPVRSIIGLPLIAQNEYVACYSVNSNRELLMRFKQPVGHLASLNYNTALTLASGLLFSSQVINEKYPTYDYRLSILDTINTQGAPTIEITIRFYQ